MHDLIAILKRFIGPYKLRVVKNVLFNLLHAVFGSISIAMLIPILEIIFNTQQETVTELVPFHLDKESLSQIFNYYLGYIKNNYGASYLLLGVGFIAIITTALKTGFAYLGA